MKSPGAFTSSEVAKRSIDVGALVLLTALTLLAASAQADSDRTPGQPPSVGIALGGGGARGAAHIGVLEVLEELRVPVHYVTGTSMGAIVGGLYASGLSPAELGIIVDAIDWVNIFQDAPPRDDRSFRRKQDDLSFLTNARLGIKDWKLFVPSGLMQGQQLSFLLRRLALSENGSLEIQELPVPFRAFASDIESGAAVVLESGDLAQAMRASMSIPGAFAPVTIDGRLLVDGMIANNLPIRDVQAMGADVVIAVDVASPRLDVEALESVLAISGQLLTIQVQQNQEQELAALGEGDIVLRPELAGIESTSFLRLEEAVRAGRQAARSAAGALQRYALSPDEYAAWKRTQRRSSQLTPVIDAIELDNRSKLADAVVLARIRAPIGERLDVDALESNIRRLYGLATFESVEFAVRRKGDENVLHIVAEEKNRGAQYLRFGLRLETNFEGASAFDFAVNHVVHPANRYGAEWRNEVLIGDQTGASSDFYQPLDARERFFLQPRISYLRRTADVYAAGQRLATYLVDDAEAALFAGVNFGNVARFLAGFGYAHASAELDTGDVATFPEANDGGGAMLASLDYDTLDNASFPNHGSYARFEAVYAPESLGWDNGLGKLQGEAVTFHTFGINTLSLGIKYGTTIEGAGDFDALFPLGGFLNLSGFQRDELRGEHAGLIRLLGYRQLASPAFFAWRFPLYFGGSLEAGNVWDDRSDLDDLLFSASAFFGLDSPLGPLYLGYGYGEGGRNRGFLFLGRGF